MNGVVTGVIILVAISVAAVGFLMVTNEYTSQYSSAINDPLNNTGIQLNNTTGYELAKNMSTSTSENLYGIIFFGMILVMLFIFAYIYNMRG